MGGGLAQLFMPLIYLAIKNSVPGWDAWRWSFFIPGAWRGVKCLVIVCVVVKQSDARRRTAPSNARRGWGRVG